MPLDCPLCTAAGGELIWQNDFARIIFVMEHGYPIFRVVVQQHVAELTDLSISERSQLMQLVCKVETAVRAHLQPDKINLASLGNMVPHLHWHMIPRWVDDTHFPAPIWATAVRPVGHLVNDIALVQLKQQLGQLQP
ncbi:MULTISPECIES: HIT family protein [Deefgea]|uniref:HIT domain-containing protein n=1 Tax=Deefgea chitinilytica TaxID=570276 RepID=A0ABS2C7J9_9NEIS|nr:MULTISPECIES: HIT family protein [Deefgea]MBM5570134.1 HIT domain-containing protein [Deefgea chitinilytica]MBM9887363.1 HIT family protein [Deefgea sp. CFH1-16]